MKRLLFLASALLCFGVQAQDKPNIVFILSDDQGWTDYGFMGHDVIQTPHLDKLADRSLVFERGYVASPLCRPSLATMATGRWPFEHGITGNDVEGMRDRATRDLPMRNAFHKFPSFIKLLTDNGYVAHQSGKWWEGSWQEGGFTAGMTHADPKRGGRHGDAGLTIGRKGMTEITGFIDGAIEAKKPFLIWYAPFLPHTPHNPPERLLNKYKADGRAADVTKYYAMCDWFDETCGELIGHLDKRKIADNTLIIYFCDNGWAAASTRKDDPDQKTWKGFALRSKGSPFEMGIRTPVMLTWPGKLTPARTQQFAHAIDLFPTIAAAANLEAPNELQGVNLLDEKARTERNTIFGVTHAIHNMTPGKPDNTLQYLWCIDEEWKLMVRYPGKNITRYALIHSWDDKTPLRLYNLIKDPHEKTNLAAKYPEIVKRLKAKIDTWHQPVIEPGLPKE